MLSAVLGTRVERTETYSMYDEVRSAKCDTEMRQHTRSNEESADGSALSPYTT